MSLFLTLRALALVLAACLSSVAWAQTADLILMNGKIITVDDRFAIAQALAIKGERVIATGSSAAIEKLRGPQTQLVDLQSRTVIPGLIDNHAHFMRAAEYWHREVRLDGITSHKEALNRISEKVRASKGGEWVVVLGGWAEEQFTDEPRGFTRQELDEIA
ncbi:MAG: amidohydrolase family protein, partial [bacterium]